MLTQVPIGFYSIEVKGNDFYQATTKQINITNEEDKDEIVIFVGMKPRIDTDIEFQFVYENISGGQRSQKLQPEKVDARAILLPRILRGNEVSEIEDMIEEEYEFDILWDARKELWVATLRPGNYLINVKAKGFKEFN